MEIEYDFWITILIGTIGGGILGPLIVKWFKKRGWLKTNQLES